VYPKIYAAGDAATKAGNLVGNSGAVRTSGLRTPGGETRSLGVIES
jgi:hypothetical protein